MQCGVLPIASSMHFRKQLLISGESCQADLLVGIYDRIGMLTSDTADTEAVQAWSRKHIVNKFPA